MQKCVRPDGRFAVENVGSLNRGANTAFASEALAKHIPWDVALNARKFDCMSLKKSRSQTEQARLEHAHRAGRKSVERNGARIIWLGW
jgi:hypothetical protein